MFDNMTPDPTDIPEDHQDFAVCLECGAEDVFFLPHKADCTESGDIVTKPDPYPWGSRVTA